ncbi:hypothetical protein [Pseudorhodoplanes sp.]|uniref:hypothetical protein n=1 Tax=Pseudorhodoplanes sp. TaxID=1934341 RepID=UPI00391AD3D6
MKLRQFNEGAAARIAWRLLCMLAVGALCWTPLAALSQQQQRTFTPTDETPEDLPAGPGRDETFYSCTPCHGFKIVAQQGLTRAQWDDSLNWMTTKHGMNQIEGEDRKLILDYLEQHYPPRTRPGGRESPNPFLN